MSIRYDENTKVRAVRLVRKHRDDYDSEWAAMKAISGRLGMNPETLRKWVRQAEVDAGEAAGMSSEEKRELRELRRKCRELESTIEILKAATSFFARECNRYTADLSVHRRAQGHLRGRTDLPSTGGAWRADRPAHLLGAPLGGAIEGGGMGHDDNRDPGWVLRTDSDGKRPPECLYGSLKMWAHLQRQGIPVARRTVERIMRRNGWRGVTRARRPPRTTEADPSAARAPDLVGRQWRVAAPNLLEVADFTYVPMTPGFGYTAFVVDAYAGLIPGWECSLVKDTGFVERALRHAVTFRTRQGHPFDNAIHHSDAGSQYTAIHYGEALMLEGLIPSVGTVGDALDNALCETTIGLYKTECIREGSPFRSGPIDTLADLENMTSAWVGWYNQCRLMHRLGRRPPADAEAEYYARLHAGKHTGHTE